MREPAVAGNGIHYQGKPCKHGHSGLRYVGSGNCVECARAAARKQQLKRYPKSSPSLV